MAISRLTQTTLQNAFQKFNTVWDGTSAVGSMDAIGVVNLNTATSSITFSSIPATYTHLQIRSFILSSSTASSATMTINATNGISHYLSGNGTAASAASDLNKMFFPLVQGSTTSGFGGVTDFLDYANTNKYKTVRTLGGYDANGSGYVNLTSNLWLSTSAITSITVTAVGTFNQYSSFALYGIK